MKTAEPAFIDFSDRSPDRGNGRASECLIDRPVKRCGENVLLRIVSGFQMRPEDDHIVQINAGGGCGRRIEVAFGIDYHQRSAVTAGV